MSIAVVVVVGGNSIADETPINCYFVCSVCLNKEINGRLFGGVKQTMGLRKKLQNRKFKFNPRSRNRNIETLANARNKSFC